MTEPSTASPSEPVEQPREAEPTAPTGGAPAKKTTAAKKAAATKKAAPAKKTAPAKKAAAAKKAVPAKKATAKKAAPARATPAKKATPATKVAAATPPVDSPATVPAGQSVIDELLPEEPSSAASPEPTAPVAAPAPAPDPTDEPADPPAADPPAAETPAEPEPEPVPEPQAETEPQPEVEPEAPAEAEPAVGAAPEPASHAVVPVQPSHAVVAVLPADAVEEPVAQAAPEDAAPQDAEPEDAGPADAGSDDPVTEPAPAAPAAAIRRDDDDWLPDVDPSPAAGGPVRPRRRLVLAGSVASLVALAGVSWAFSRGSGGTDSATPVPGSTVAVVSVPASGTGAPTPSASSAKPSAKPSGSGTPSRSSSATASSAKPSARPTVGSSVAAGNGVIERITLVGVRSYTKPSASNGRKPLLGRFVRVTLSIKVTGSGSVPFDPLSAFYLRDTHGEQYLPYAMAAATETSGDPLRPRTLKPGNRVTGSVTFDAPGEPLTLIYATQDGGRIVATWPISS